MAINFLPYTIPLYYLGKLIYLSSPKIFSETPGMPHPLSASVHEVAKRVLIDEKLEETEYMEQIEEILENYTFCCVKESLSNYVESHMIVEEKHDVAFPISHKIINRSNLTYLIDLHPQAPEKLLPFCVAREINSILREDILNKVSLRLISSFALCLIADFAFQMNPWNLFILSLSLSESISAAYQIDADIESDYFALKHCIDDELIAAREALVDSQKRGVSNQINQIYIKLFGSSLSRIEKVLDDQPKQP